MAVIPGVHRVQLNESRGRAPLFFLLIFLPEPVRIETDPGSPHSLVLRIAASSPRKCMVVMPRSKRTRTEADPNDEIAPTTQILKAEERQKPGDTSLSN